MSSEKLDFLMKLAEKKNSELGKYISFDASYISRIRTGNRKLPSNEDFLAGTSAFLARSLTTPWQRQTLADVMHITSLPQDEAQFAGMIHDWLTSSSDIGPEGLTLPKASRPSSAVSQSRQDILSDNDNQTNIFYGFKGKRQAVKFFL